jgi:hypothetical protein
MRGFVTCPADFDSNGQVDVFDLLTLLAAWGPALANEADLNETARWISSICWTCSVSGDSVRADRRLR